MSQTYRQAITAARERYKVAMDEAAADALMIVEDYDRPLQTVCKEIADDGWNALRQRAQKLAKTTGQNPEERARVRQREAEASNQRVAKSILKDPEKAAQVIAKLPATALDDLYHEVRLARANEDRSPAARKAANASAHQAAEPIRRAIAATHAALALQALQEAYEDLTKAVEERAISKTQVLEAERLVNSMANLLMEATFTGVTA